MSSDLQAGKVWELGRPAAAGRQSIEADHQCLLASLVTQVVLPLFVWLTQEVAEDCVVLAAAAAAATAGAAAAGARSDGTNAGVPAGGDTLPQQGGLSRGLGKAGRHVVARVEQQSSLY